MSVNGLHHVQVNVGDVDAAVAFYTRLGISVRSDRPDIGVDGAWLDAGAQQLHVVEAPTPPDLGQHFAVEVDALDRLVAELRRDGVVVADPARLGPALGRQTSVLDPAGNRVELREPPPHR